MKQRWLVGMLLLVTVLLVSANVWHSARYSKCLLQLLETSLINLEATLLDAKEIPIANRGWMLKQSRVHVYHAIKVMYELYPDLVNDELRGNPIFLFHPETEYSKATDEELVFKNKKRYTIFATCFSQEAIGTIVGREWHKRS